MFLNDIETFWKLLLTELLSHVCTEFLNTTRSYLDHVLLGNVGWWFIWWCSMTSWWSLILRNSLTWVHASWFFFIFLICTRLRWNLFTYYFFFSILYLIVIFVVFIVNQSCILMIIQVRLWGYISTLLCLLYIFLLLLSFFSLLNFAKLLKNVLVMKDCMSKFIFKYLTFKELCNTRLNLWHL